VQIYQVGATEAEPGRDPIPFMALEFLDGGSLDRKIGTPWPVRQAAELVETLARHPARPYDAYLHQPIDVLFRGVEKHEAGRLLEHLAAGPQRRGQAGEVGLAPPLLGEPLLEQIEGLPSSSLQRHGRRTSPLRV